MELKELLQLPDNTIFNGKDSEGNRYLGLMLKYYSEMFGQSCFSCPKKFPVYLNQLRNRVMKKDKVQKFQLSKDVCIPIFGTSEVYSEKNLTDEAALKILSKNKNAVKLFKKVPKDWEEQVEAYIQGQNITSIDGLAELKVEAIRALFPDAKGRSREDLLKDIAEKYPELKSDAQKEAERKAQEEADKKEKERKEKEESDRKAAEEKKVKEEADRKAKEEEELKAKEEEELKAKEEEESKSEEETTE